MKKQIDISEYIKNRKEIFGVNGRKLGQTQRKALKIEQVEKEFDTIEVKIPENYLSMSSSFFLGLFGKSVRKCGSKEAFLKKYTFETSDEIMKSILEGIDDALREGNGLK